MSRASRCILLVTGLLAVSMSFGQALAQTPEDEVFATVSPAQAQLNTEGIQLASQGEHEKAIKLFESSLQLDDLNVTWLNLGRSLAKLGRCEGAVAAYDKVESSPRVRKPDPATVVETLGRFRADLETQCPGRISVQCELAETEIQVDDRPAAPCGSEVFEVPPGAHRVVARTQGQEVAVDVQARGLETVGVTFALERAQSPAPAPQEAERSSLALLGWVSVGTGAALLASGLVMDFAVLGPLFDDLEAAGRRGDAEAHASYRDGLEQGQLVNQVILVGGGAVLATGIALVVIDALSGERDEAPAGEGVSLHPLVGPSQAGAAFSWTF